MSGLLSALFGVAAMAAVPAVQSGTGAGVEEHTATAVLRDAEGKSVGTASLRETQAGVLLKVEFTVIAPGVHGFHVHEHGRCDAPSFESAGGHLGRSGATHGFLQASRPHEGDLPNIHVPQNRELTVEVIITGVTLRTGDGSLLDADGSALVVHAGPDDYESQPAGDAGSRIACGVIAH